MSGFDPIGYLSRLAEPPGDGKRALLTERTPLLSAAQALVAIGQVDEVAVQELLDAHERELRRREPGRAIRWARELPAAPLVERRVAVSVGGVERHLLGLLRVRYVVFAEQTRVAIALRRRRRPRVTLSARVPWGIRARSAPHIAGDDGVRFPTGFSGSGNGGQWTGVLSSFEPLDPATRSIAIDGVRFELAEVMPEVSVRLEALPPADAAIRHLWRVAGLTDDFSDPQIEHAIEALVACGAVRADVAELELIRAVASARWKDGAPREHAIASLPESWRALWRADRTGPVRVLAVGAVTPLFDGTTVAVNVLESFAEGWRVDVDYAPEGAGTHPHETPTARLTGLVWWAQDDRGNRYLKADGHVQTSVASGGGGHCQSTGGSGSVHFAPPLDPRARWIELQPTAETTRAVIRISLD